ncbi:hypothetical protein AAHA92_03560 [Salvia divinorum]|uniref:Uncharacterized protein n=1 Tax=Salvia divinorum TaxID=28513 RepID=A0ABD1IHH5_SALDI
MCVRLKSVEYYYDHLDHFHQKSTILNENPNSVVPLALLLTIPITFLSTQSRGEFLFPTSLQLFHDCSALSR